ncbi:hypothetical protein E2C01_096400 [Portunus trituberculatus]|uniref:Uncharacterized protein n=1 Tax=Portunus trituberculatus TaxID=210409 RepID=A0A5B7K849_PORTR|nr:hypothetical protein [Portunus trituberculatus]
MKIRLIISGAIENGRGERTVSQSLRVHNSDELQLGHCKPHSATLHQGHVLGLLLARLSNTHNQ